METFPKFEERGNAEQEVLQGLKESFIELCRQMKEQIETGVYDALVSDDSGGRIPTLLFRSILKLVKPEHNFKTLFVASGQFHRPKNLEDEEKLLKYLRTGLGNAKNVLLITQYIHSGKTIKELNSFIRRLGVRTIDVSTINTDEINCSTVDCDNLFVGGVYNRTQLGFNENHNVLSGISKRKKYDPRPMRLDKVIEGGEKERSSFLSFNEQDEVLDIGEYDSLSEIKEKQDRAADVFNKIDSIPLSEEEKRAIQQNINKTREHIKKLAEEIVYEVWGNLN